MTKPFLLSALLVFLAIGTFSQEVTPTIPQHHYIGMGAGISNVAVKDQLNTSLSYSGLNLGTVFDVTTTFKKSFLQVRNILVTGGLTPYRSTSAKRNQIDYYYENFSAAWYRNVYCNHPNDLYLFVGPALNAKLGMRINDGEIGNSALTYEAAGSVALAAKAMKYFNVFTTGNNENKQFKIEGSLSLPVISTVFTPPYIGLPENLAQEGGSIIDFNSHYTGYLSNYFNLELGLSLTYYLKNRNAIEVSYLRDYTSTRPAINPAKTMNQFISLKLLYNLN
jgi:hypothetical protein